MPRLPFIPPAQPILVSEPPTGPQWLHEIKWDGWRCQIIKDDHGIRIYSRRGTDWSAQLPGIVDAARYLEADSFIIDGELVAIGGQSDFYAIPTAIKRRQVCVVAFDLLNLNGDDIRQAALEERRVRLEDLLALRTAIVFSAAFSDGAALLQAAEARGLEGVVSKRKDRPYKPGPCSHWRKTKTAIWLEDNKDRFEKMAKR